MPEWRVRQLILLIGDVALLYAALFLALAARVQEIRGLPLGVHIRPFTIVFGIWLAVLFLRGMYDLSMAKNNMTFFRAFLSAMAINTLVAAGFFYLIPNFSITPKTILFLTAGFFILFFTLWRMLWNKKLGRIFLKNRVLFAGLTPETQELIEIFNRHPQIGYETVALVVREPTAREMEARTVVGFETIGDLIARENVHTVVLADAASGDNTLTKVLYDTLFSRVLITSSIAFFENVTNRVPTSALSETWFLENIRESQKRFYDTFRVAADYILASVAGVVTLALFPAIALAIWLDDRGSPLYCHTRVGRGGLPFTIVKFRTMRTDAEKEGPQFTQARDPRITRVGKFLRRVRIDELPQVWNVLRGEMSLIGPRPERPEFVAELTAAMPFYPIRHLVRPGMTGWAQVNYSYAETIKKNLIKLQYDIFYIKNRSLLLDIATVLKTLNVIVRGQGQ